MVLEKLLRIPWTAKKTNNWVWEQIGEEFSTEAVALQLKLTFFGHVMRSTSLEKDIMLGMGNGKRKKGRPRIRWVDEVKEALGLSLQALKEEVGDRDRSRKMVKSAARDRHAI